MRAVRSFSTRVLAPALALALALAACGDGASVDAGGIAVGESALQTSCDGRVNWVAASNGDCGYTSPCAGAVSAGSLCSDGYPAYWEPLRKLLHCEHWTDTSGDPTPLRGVAIQVRDSNDKLLFSTGFGRQDQVVNGQSSVDETGGIQSATMDWSNPNLRAKIASSTKAVTAVTALAALQAAYPGTALADALDNRVGTYLNAGLCGASGALDIPPGSPVRDITLGELMSFTSGLGDASSYDASAATALQSCTGNPAYTTTSCACEILRFADAHRSASIADPSVNPFTEPEPARLLLPGGAPPEHFYFHKPGYTYKYHDQHLTVLAAIVSFITGRTMNDLLQDEIAKPLGINTTLSRRWFFGNDVTASYTGADNNPNYAGSLASTVAEFMAFEGMIAHYGSASASGAPVLDPAVIVAHETAGFPAIRLVPQSPGPLAGGWNGYFSAGTGPHPAFVVALFSPMATSPGGASASLVPALYGRNTWLRAAHLAASAGYVSFNPFCLYAGGCPADAARPYADGSPSSCASFNTGLLEPDSLVIDSLVRLGPADPPYCPSPDCPASGLNVTDPYQWLGHNGKDGWTPWVDRASGAYAVIGKYRPTGGGASDYSAGDASFSDTVQAIVSDLVRTYASP